MTSSHRSASQKHPTHTPTGEIVTRLQERGVAIVETPLCDDSMRLSTRHKMDDMLSCMNEFKRPDEILQSMLVAECYNHTKGIKKVDMIKPDPAHTFVMGGFSALGNPSSFHNMVVRDLRQVCMLAMVPLMSGVASRQESAEGWKLEQLVDRLMVRPSNWGPGNESWHRDSSPSADPSDLVFGGWLNMDDAPQMFSCVPGSHADDDAVGKNTGFELLHKVHDAERVAACSRNKEMVSVPPGCIVVFYDRILHEVTSHTRRNMQYRLFTGWRLTRQSSPLNTKPSMFAQQAAMPLKSNQLPPMYAKLHRTNWIDRLAEFSTAFYDSMLVEDVVSKGDNKGRTFRRIERFLPSLAELGLPLYPVYTQEELSMHVPAQEWTLRTVDGEHKTVHLYPDHETKRRRID